MLYTRFPLVWPLIIKMSHEKLPCELHWEIVEEKGFVTMSHHRLTYSMLNHLEVLPIEGRCLDRRRMLSALWQAGFCLTRLYTPLRTGTRWGNWGAKSRSNWSEVVPSRGGKSRLGHWSPDAWSPVYPSRSRVSVLFKEKTGTHVLRWAVGKLCYKSLTHWTENPGESCSRPLRCECSNSDIWTLSRSWPWGPRWAVCSDGSVWRPQELSQPKPT